MTASETEMRLAPARLPKGEPTAFRVIPDEAGLAELVSGLDLLGLRKLRFEGQIRPEGRNDWRLEGRLGATAIQPCSVTLAPVTTRIDRVVRRLYVAGYVAPSEAESEMPEDDSIEPLPASIDLMALLTEELALALPDFPRAEGAELAATAFAEPGTEPLTDEALKPFAGLAALRKSLED
ncbi:MAG: YceD family protein [Tropicimonas sp.]|uniref:YceD family protein n=1 Tax=Tropicimonas sp. TaxID=2067044 RepID=UPI003A83CC24